jgi:hypothetical protein
MAWIPRGDSVSAYAEIRRVHSMGQLCYPSYQPTETKVLLHCIRISGLYYKHVTIVNDDSSVVSK